MFLSDTDVVVHEKCMCNICMTVDCNTKLQPMTILKCGKYAVYHIKCHRKEIYPEYQGFLCV